MKRVVVIGLGIFGFNLAKDLFEAGLEVIAVDKNKDLVQKIRDFSTKAVVADATEKEVLETIGIQAESVPLETETFFENWFGLAADGQFGARGLPKSFLQLVVVAREYRREIGFPPPLNWIVTPLSFALAPVARLRGYRGRYDRYSGPTEAGPAPGDVEVSS